ncbi:hypothetical protein ACLOJK_003969 [Asimina triloba]
MGETNELQCKRDEVEAVTEAAASVGKKRLNHAENWLMYTGRIVPEVDSVKSELDQGANLLPAQLEQQGTCEEPLQRLAQALSDSDEEIGIIGNKLDMEFDDNEAMEEKKDGVYARLRNKIMKYVCMIQRDIGLLKKENNGRGSRVHFLEDSEIKVKGLACKEVEFVLKCTKALKVSTPRVPGSIDNVNDFNETLNKGHDIVERLKDACLLEDGEIKVKALTSKEAWNLYSDKPMEECTKGIERISV